MQHIPMQRTPASSTCHASFLMEVPGTHSGRGPCTNSGGGMGSLLVQVLIVVDDLGVRLGVGEHWLLPSESTKTVI